jgi:hypothetical protein
LKTPDNFTIPSQSRRPTFYEKDCNMLHFSQPIAQDQPRPYATTLLLEIPIHPGPILTLKTQTSSTLKARKWDQ